MRFDHIYAGGGRERLQGWMRMVQGPLKVSKQETGTWYKHGWHSNNVPPTVSRDKPPVKILIGELQETFGRIFFAKGFSPPCWRGSVRQVARRGGISVFSLCSRQRVRRQRDSGTFSVTRRLFKILENDSWWEGKKIRKERFSISGKIGKGEIWCWWTFLLINMHNSSQLKVKDHGKCWAPCDDKFHREN